MKYTSLLSVGLMGLALSASSLVAQTISVATGDLILGFRAGSGTGASSNLEVKLGSFSNFNTLFTAGTNFTQIANLSTALSTTYGANWNTRSDLYWGFSGNTSNLNKTIYASKVSTVGAQSTPYVSPSTSTLNGVAGFTGLVTTGLNGQTASFGTTNAAVLDTSGSTSYSTAIYRDTTAVAFGLFAPTEFENTTEFAGGAAYAVSDLYRLLPNTSGQNAGYFGTFALSNTGMLTYNAMASAIPEPSTFAALAGFAMLGFAMIRRRAHSR